MSVFSILVARHDPSPAGATALVNDCAGDRSSKLDSIKMTLTSVSICQNSIGVSGNVLFPGISETSPTVPSSTEPSTTEGVSVFPRSIM